MARGVKLRSFYATPQCSPTRGAFLTGRYPHRWGGQSGVAEPGCIAFVNENEVTLAERLQAVGYYTAWYGKWHLGHARRRYTPPGRGFNESLAVYYGQGDHWDHSVIGLERARALRLGMPPSARPVDLHRDSILDGHEYVLDRNGTYSGDVFTEEAVGLIRRHEDTSGPLFITLALMQPHSPIQVPARFLSMNAHLGPKRRAFGAMVSSLDANVQSVVEALEDRGYWEDTIMFFFSDNGAEPRPTERNTDPTAVERGRPTSPQMGASNWPWRGTKFQSWEGGVHVPAFVCGRGLPQGVEHHGLFSVTDFFPTIVNLAGGNTLLPNGNLLDGRDQWDSLIDTDRVDPASRTTARTEIVLQYDSAVPIHGYPHDGVVTRAIRVGNFKLLEGHIGTGDWWPQDVSTTDGEPEQMGDGPALIVTSVDPITGGPLGRATPALRLYDIGRDPEERYDLAPTMPGMVARLRARLDEVGRDAVLSNNLASRKAAGGFDVRPLVPGDFSGAWIVPTAFLDSADPRRLLSGWGGYITLILSAVLNGSAFVPLKQARQRWSASTKMDGSAVTEMRDEVFQLWWGLAAAAVQTLTGVVGCIFGRRDASCLAFEPLGLLGGASVFCATVFVFIAVRHLGVAVEPSLVAASFVTCSLGTSLLFLDVAVTSAGSLVLALCLIISGSAGVAQSRRFSNHSGNIKSGHLDYATAVTRDPMPESEEEQSSDAAPQDVVAVRAVQLETEGLSSVDTRVSVSLVTGVVAAIAVGFFGSMVPFLAKVSKATTGIDEWSLLPSVGLGLFLSTLVGIPCRLQVSHAMGIPPVPAGQYSTVCGAGLLSGALWGGGNVLLNLGLGSGVALPVASSIYQCAVLVGGMWGILWFRELTGAIAVGTFFASAIGVVVGIVLLAGITVNSDH